MTVKINQNIALQRQVCVRFVFQFKLSTINSSGWFSFNSIFLKQKLADTDETNTTTKQCHNPARTTVGDRRAQSIIRWHPKAVYVTQVMNVWIRLGTDVTASVYRSIRNGAENYADSVTHGEKWENVNNNNSELLLLCCTIFFY